MKKDGLLKTLFNFDSRKLEKAIVGYESGIMTCEGCKTKIDITEQYSLDMVNCPKCDDLIMIPMKIQSWWIEQPLGGGGMGCVYRARHGEQPEMQAAVKILQRTEDVSQVHLDMLINEAKVAASFGSNPHLSETYAYGFQDEQAYFIMELIDGTRFDDQLAVRGGRVPLEEALYYMLDILNALEHIYSCGYIFRDLKPENIIIRKNGLVALVDYGLCMTIDDAWNDQSEDIMGSPLYMPPERCLGGGEDFRGDLYSLGMVFYHLMTGETYFSQTEILQIIRQSTRGLRLQTSFKLKAFDPAVATLIDTLIKKERDERMQSYDEVRQHIFPLLAGLQAEATKDSVILKRRNHFKQVYNI